MHGSRIPRVLVLSSALAILAACSARSSPPVVATTPHEMVSDDYHVPLAIEDVRGVMYAKLAHTHALFEGMVTEDLEQVAENADELRKLSDSAGFRPHRTVAYGVFSDEFGAIAARIAEDARRDDLNAVHRDYVRLTDTCVRCHSYLSKEHLKLDLPGAVSLSQ